MKKKDILRLIKNLSLSQGMYGRLLRDINEQPEILDTFEDMNFGSDLDFVMWFEGR